MSEKLIRFLIHSPTIPTWLTRSNRCVTFSTRDKRTEDHPSSKSLQLLFDHIPFKRKHHFPLLKLLSTDVGLRDVIWCDVMWWILSRCVRAGRGIFIVKNVWCRSPLGLRWYKLYRGPLKAELSSQFNFVVISATPLPLPVIKRVTFGGTHQEFLFSDIRFISIQ